MVKVILGSIGAFPIFNKLVQFVSRKGLVVERNGVKFGPRVSIQCIQGTFDTYVVKVILGSFGAFPIFDKLVSRKRINRAKRSEIWPSGVSIQCIQGTFDTSVVKVILGSFGAFSDFRQASISKTGRAKR